MRQPLNILIGKPITCQRNTDLIPRFQFPQDLIPQLARQPLKSSSQTDIKAWGESAEEAVYWCETRQEGPSEVPLQIFIRIAGDASHFVVRGVEVPSRLDEDELEPWCRYCFGDTVFAEEMPGRCDQRWEIMQLKVVEYHK